MTWNRYAAALARWEEFPAAAGTTFLPAVPAHFANFFAEAAARTRGYTQSKLRSRAIDALSMLAAVASGTLADPLARAVRAGLRLDHRSG